MLQARNYFEEYAVLDDPKTELLREINKYIQDRGFVNELDLKRLLKQEFYADKKSLQSELHYLVCNNFLYYNPTFAKYKLQGKSMEIGFDLFIKKVAD